MKLKVDYLNKEKETRHIITDEENVWILTYNLTYETIKEVE